MLRPVALALALYAAPALAQSTSEPWRTIETEHYRIHYPVSAEAWALDSAARFEAIRERVSAEVGYAPPQKVDVVVMDPFTGANGFALPFLGAPRMGVFPTAPEAGSGIANYRLWSEDLVVHEDAHLAHLLRPSRSPFGKLWQGITGSGPVAVKSPAWVVEGYATVVEGRLTGFGRPNSAGRAAWLRGLAQDGQLPSYGELDSSGRWGGGSMRYLVGSAYLEWLDEHHSAHDEAGQSLRDLWARMTARKPRTFEEAFEGVYGDDPVALYGRFVAEMTADSLAIEAARPADASTLWLDLSESTGAPALSADGTRIALVERRKMAPPRLVVRDTAVDAEAATKRKENIDEMLAKDPEDVAAVPPGTDEHETVATRVNGGRNPQTPRYQADGSLLFTAWVFDASGDLVPDLFVWDPEEGGERRITRGASVRDADPYDTSAIGVWTSGGSSALVKVDLATGATEDLTARSPVVVYDQPRVSPDHARVAFLRHHEGRWGIGVQAIAGGAETPVALPDGSEPFSVAWESDGALLASLGRAGFVEIWRLDLAMATWSQVTHSRGGAYAPTPAPDGGLYFLSPDAEGFDVRHLAGALPVPAGEEAGAEARPTVPGASAEPSGEPPGPSPEGEPAPGEPWGGPPRPPIPTGEPVTVTADPPAVQVRTPVLPPPPFEAPGLVESRTLDPARHYGLGPQHLRPLIGGVAGPGLAIGEVGLFVGDPIGRSEIVALAALGTDENGGGSLAFTWRGLPVRTTARGYLLGSDDWRGGAALDLGWGTRTGQTTWALAAGAWADAKLEGGDVRQAVRGGLSVRSTPWVGPVRLAAAFAADGQALPEAWIGHGEASLGFRAGTWGLNASAEGWAADGASLTLGGLRPSYLPDGPASFQAYVPWIAPDPAEDPILRARVGLDLAGIGSIFGERVLSGDDVRTIVGLDGRFDTDAQPLGRIPGVSLESGVGCVVEGAPANDAPPCTTLEDWALWAGIRWVPGRPAAMP